MTAYAVGVTITNSQPGAVNGYRPNSVTAAQFATVAADVATLVADGASPTQAHVTTLNTDWGTLVAGKDLSADDVVLVVNTTNVTTRAMLRQAIAKLLTYYDGLGALT